MPALKDPIFPVWVQAAKSLALRERESPGELWRFIDSPDEKIRSGIMLALALARVDAVRPILRKSLNPSVSDERWFAAAVGSAYLQQVDSATAQSFVGTLRGPPSLRRLGADGALRVMVAEDPGIVRLIIPLLSESENGLAAANILGRSGNKGVPLLIPLLKNADAVTRANTAVALSQIGPDAQAAVPSLSALVDDTDDAVRSYAVEALGEIGPAAAPAAPRLVETALSSATSTNEYYLSLAATDALIKIGPLADPAAQAAIGRPNNPRIRARLRAVLGMHGRSARERVAALLWKIGEKRDEHAALSQMNSMGPQAAEALLDLLDDDAFREWAQGTLLMLKPFPERELLRKLDDGGQQNVAILWLLAKGGSPDVVADLTRRGLLRPMPSP